ncbi:MAG: hypothetical protein QXH79_04745 [Candidatus Bathyarchaeia archaeon]
MGVFLDYYARVDAEGGCEMCGWYNRVYQLGKFIQARLWSCNGGVWKVC